MAIIFGYSNNLTTGNNGKNPKSGWQKYTDEVDTVHELNSGSTLKFTASDTLFRCSVHTEPIDIETDAD